MFALVLLGGSGSTKLELAQDGFSAAPLQTPMVKQINSVLCVFCNAYLSKLKAKFGLNQFIVLLFEFTECCW